MKTTLKKITNAGIKNFRATAFGVVFLTAGSLQAQTYCSPTLGDCSDGDEITNVTFEGINNTSTCGTGYNDFTSLAAAQLTSDQAYTLSVTVANADVAAAAWIDFNNNGVFEATEFFDLGVSEESDEVLTASIAIPVSAVGDVRMRIKSQFLFGITSGQSCSEPFLGYGEYEDYTVNITPSTTCSGTPVVGTPTATVTSACAAVPFLLTATIAPAAGLSYQWQVSTNGGTDWTNIGTAQNSGVYTVENQTVASSYRVVVTCSGGSNAASAAVAVGQNIPVECYCINSVPMDCNDGDLILNVLFGSIDNSSDCGNTDTGYTSYIDSVDPAIVRLGEAVDISVTVGDGFDTESVGVWIDFNQNGTFEASEYTYVGTGFDEAVSASVNIPADALLGETRMRVVLSAAAASSFSSEYSCGSIDPDYFYGEIEDYLVDVQPALSTPGFNSSNFAMYPNPSTGVVNFKFGNSTSVSAINVYSLSGQLILNKQFSSSSDNYSIDMQKASTGVYIVKVETENGTQINRLIKN